MSTTTVQLPSGFASDLASNSSSFLSNMSPLILLIAGVLLGAVVIELVIGAIRHRG